VERASEAPQRQVREAAERLSATYERTAQALEYSAALAEHRAEREEQPGRHDAAARSGS